MQFHNIPERPWCKVAVDVFTLCDHSYLVIVYFYSDFWDIDELNSANSSQIITACKRHFARYGIPNQLISDNAAVFIGSDFTSFAKAWEFTHITSSPYYSRANGKVEGAVKIAKQLLAGSWNSLTCQKI